MTEIARFIGSDKEIELLACLTEYAASLEKIVFDSGGYRKSKDFTSGIERLRSRLPASVELVML